ncbi:MAG: hypothetical protein IIW48_13065 [Clostridia bacterium]|nr:hypothetical protein [Clostridia bacterium]
MTEDCNKNGRLIVAPTAYANFIFPVGAATCRPNRLLKSFQSSVTCGDSSD